MKKIIFIGAGGHSRSVLDSLSPEYDLYGYIDDIKTGTFYGKPIIGKKIEEVENYREYFYFITIGDNIYRKKWFDILQKMHLEPINIIDSSSYISPTAKIGVGNFIGKSVIINASSEIGNNNIINSKALIEHECMVGNHVHLSTNSTINGNVRVGNGVFLGSGAICIGQLSVGENSTIGAGAVVIGDIPAGVTAVGVPARIIKQNGKKI